MKPQKSADDDQIANSNAFETKKQQLNAINKEIRDQNAYYVDQKTMVETAIGNWNIQLQSFHREGERLSDEILVKTQKVDELTIQAQHLAAKIEVLKVEYSKKLEEYRRLL